MVKIIIVDQKLQILSTSTVSPCDNTNVDMIMLGKELLKLCHKAYVNWSSFFPEVKQTYKPLPNTYKYVIKPTTADKRKITTWLPLSQSKNHLSDSSMLNIYKQTVHDVTVVQKCQNLFKSSLLKLSSKTLITSVTLRSEAVCRFICGANGIQNWN